MTAKDGAQKPPSLRSVWIALALGAIFALLVCIICLYDVGRPAGRLHDYRLEEVSDPPVHVESVRQDKEFLRIEGAVPGMRTKPYQLRVGLLRDTGEKELVLMRTQMVRRADIGEQYQCDDHCGFAAALSLRNLTGGDWQVALVFGADGEETVRMTEEIVSIGE